MNVMTSLERSANHRMSFIQKNEMCLDFNARATNIFTSLENNSKILMEHRSSNAIRTWKACRFSFIYFCTDVKRSKQNEQAQLLSSYTYSASDDDTHNYKNHRFDRNQYRCKSVPNGLLDLVMECPMCECIGLLLFHAHAV